MRGLASLWLLLVSPYKIAFGKSLVRSARSLMVAVLFGGGSVPFWMVTSGNSYGSHRRGPTGDLFWRTLGRQESVAGKQGDPRRAVLLVTKGQAETCLYEGRIFDIDIRICLR